MIMKDPIKLDSSDQVVLGVLLVIMIALAVLGTSIGINTRNDMRHEAIIREVAHYDDYGEFKWNQIKEE